MKETLHRRIGFEYDNQTIESQNKTMRFYHQLIAIVDERVYMSETLNYIGRPLNLMSEKFFEENIDSFPISRSSVLFHYNLIQDSIRVIGLKEAIKQIVKKGDTVVDLGSGSAILSKYAQENAKTVYAIEVDKEIAKYGEKFCKHLKNIKYIEDDFRNVTLPEKADVVICEMIDTCFISETQIPTMNYAIKWLLKRNGKTIPFGAKTTVQLVHQNYQIPDDTDEIRLPHYEDYGSPKSKAMSSEVQYQILKFSEINPLFYKRSVDFVSERDGIANSVKFITYTETMQGTFLEPSNWLNPPLIIPLEENIQLKRGEHVSFDISYHAGAGVNRIDIR